MRNNGIHIGGHARWEQILRRGCQHAHHLDGHGILVCNKNLRRIPDLQPCVRRYNRGVSAVFAALRRQPRAAGTFRRIQANQIRIVQPQLKVLPIPCAGGNINLADALDGFIRPKRFYHAFFLRCVVFKFRKNIQLIILQFLRRALIIHPVADKQEQFGQHDDRDENLHDQHHIHDPLFFQERCGEHDASHFFISPRIQKRFGSAATAAASAAAQPASRMQIRRCQSTRATQAAAASGNR